jgi:hypothetical protein
MMPKIRRLLRSTRHTEDDTGKTVSTSPTDRHDSSASDAELAPLAWPTVVLGAGMLVTGAVYAVRIPRWAADYGSVLVYFVVIAYVVLAGATVRWGLAIRRGGRRPDTEPDGAEASEPGDAEPGHIEFIEPPSGRVVRVPVARTARRPLVPGNGPPGHEGPSLTTSCLPSPDAAGTERRPVPALWATTSVARAYPETCWGLWGHRFGPFGSTAASSKAIDT